MKVEELPAPRIITFEPTNRCSGHCITCNNWKNTKARLLGADTYKKTIDEAADAGVIHLNFAGGDPLLYPGIFQLIERVKSVGMETALITMGTTLSERGINRLLASGIDIVRFSLDSPDQVTHNYIRGVAGAFEKGVRSINLLSLGKQKAGLQKPIIVINMTVSQANFRQVDEMAQFSRQLRVDCLTYGLVVQTDESVAAATNERFKEEVCSRQFATERSKGLLLDVEQAGELKTVLGQVKENIEGEKFFTNARSVLAMLSRLENVARGEYLRDGLERGTLHCPYPASRLVIDAEGNAYPCSPIRYFLGNIRSQPVMEIWTGRRRREFIKSFNGEDWPKVCFFCCSLKPN